MHSIRLLNCTLVNALHLRAFYIVHGPQSKNSYCVTAPLESFNSPLLSVLALEDGIKVFHAESFSGGGAGTQIVS